MQYLRRRDDWETLAFYTATGLVAVGFVLFGAWLYRRWVLGKGGALGGALGGLPQQRLLSSVAGDVIRAPFDRFVVSSIPVQILGQDGAQHARTVNITTDSDITVWHSKQVEQGGGGFLVTPSTPVRLDRLPAGVELWAVRATGSDANVGISSYWA